VVLPGDAKGKVQVIPVGAGEAQTLQWEGFEVVWANWFPDSQHILLRGNPGGQPVGLYETDRGGSAPKMLVKEAPGWGDVMPDGENLLLLVGDTLVKRSLKDGSEVKMRTLEPGEVPVDWAKEPNYLFTEIVGATNVQIFKTDLGSDKREPWQVITPKDLEGAMLVMEAGTITPDGKWMMVNYVDPRGEFYTSENLQ
jgi:hypothetical protein